MSPFLEPKSREAVDPARREMVSAFDMLLAARLGYTIELDYTKRFTEVEYDCLQRRLDDLLSRRPTKPVKDNLPDAVSWTATTILVAVVTFAMSEPRIAWWTSRWEIFAVWMIAPVLATYFWVLWFRRRRA